MGTFMTAEEMSEAGQAITDRNSQWELFFWALIKQAHLNGRNTSC